MTDTPTFDADHDLTVANGYFQTGEFARSAEVCRRAVHDHPADARLWDRLGLAAWATDDWPQTVEALEAVGRIGECRPLARLALADAYLALGRRTDAVPVLRELARPGACWVELLPDVAGRLFRAGVFRGAGDVISAEACETRRDSLAAGNLTPAGIQ